LQIEHHGGNLFRLHWPADTLVADFPVLTKHAAEITPTEKNCPRSSPAPKDIFLSMVRPKTMDDRSLPRPANRPLDCKQAINMAVTSTQVASFHVVRGLAHALRQIPRSKEL
jgi:hypothetical protein